MSFIRIENMEFYAYHGHFKEEQIVGNKFLVNLQIETDMTKDIPEEFKEKILNSIPLERMGQPEEVAEVVSFLATRGGYCTGSVFHINGGMYCG